MDFRVGLYNTHISAKANGKKRSVSKLFLLLLLVFTLSVFTFALYGCANDADLDGKQAAVDIDDCIIPQETAHAAEIPSEAPEPTQAPSVSATEAPTPAPTAVLTIAPTAAPTEQVNPAQPKKMIYLTFDDGPSKYTDEVLDILNEYNIKATFFTVGMSIRQHPKQAARIAADGHALACHTESHDFSKLYNGVEGFVDQINKWRQTVISNVGYDAGAYVMRFPGGTSNSTIGRAGRGAYVNAANNLGYKVFDWNIGLNDRWLAGNKKNLPKSEYFWESYIDTLSMYKNIEPKIFLIHDTEQESVKLLRRIIDDLISKGYEFGCLTDVESNYLM